MPPLTYSLLPPLMRKTTRLALLAITPLAACGVLKHTYVAEGVSVLSYRSQRLSPALSRGGRRAWPSGRRANPPVMSIRCRASLFDLQDVARYALDGVGISPRQLRV